jgi:hypothetical protein
MEEMPQIVDPVTMVGMIVGPDDCVQAHCPGIEQLLAQVWARVDKDPCLSMLDQDRGPASSVPGFGWIAFAPVTADPRNAE